MKVYNKEDLSYKNIVVLEDGKPPEKIEVTEDIIKINAKSLRGKAILDRLNYQGKLTQEIYI
ncbi:MAG: pantothenate kinase [Aquificaceae bacterium]